MFQEGVLMRSLEEFNAEKEVRALRSEFEAFKVEAVNDQT